MSELLEQWIYNITSRRFDDENLSKYYCAEKMR